MMKESGPLPPYVSKADGDEVYVSVSDSALNEHLIRLGFRLADDLVGTLIRRTIDDREKGLLFGVLRDIGICFARGREWNPAEVFELLRDQGLVSGAFRSITWMRPGEWMIREE